jgi:hypothetical protein
MNSYKKSLFNLKLEEVPLSKLSDAQKLVLDILNEFFQIEYIPENNINGDVTLINYHELDKFKDHYSNFKFVRSRKTKYSISTFSLIATITLTLTGHYLAFITNYDSVTSLSNHTENRRVTGVIWTRSIA